MKTMRLCLIRGGGGDFVDGKVVNGGHLWFPKYETIEELLSNSLFDDFTFLHYYDPENQPVMKEIDYSLGYISRTPDHDSRVQNPDRPMSIVVDCYKKVAQEAQELIPKKRWFQYITWRLPIPLTGNFGLNWAPQS